MIKKNNEYFDPFLWSTGIAICGDVIDEPYNQQVHGLLARCVE
ncbi:MAG: hypothetical protein R8K50_02115 [Mariprofundus sp.]